MATIPLAERDIRKADKLKVENSGILNWSLAGRKRLYAQNGFTRSRVGEDWLEQYQASSNPAKEFLLDHCEVAADQFVMKQKLYEDYKQWVELRGYRPLDESLFSQEVKRAFPKKTESRRLTIAGVRCYVHQGIRLVTQSSEAEQDAEAA